MHRPVLNGVNGAFLQVEPKVVILAVGGSLRVTVSTPDDEFFLSVEKSLSRASIPNGR